VALSFRWVGILDIVKNPLAKALQQIELEGKLVPAEGGCNKSMVLPQLPSVFSCSRQKWLVAIRELKRSISSVFREYAEKNPEDPHVLKTLRSLGTPNISKLLQRFSNPDFQQIVESFSGSQKLNFTNLFVGRMHGGDGDDGEMEEQ
jgi:hypothetical protein